ncbi:hypothetical protein [Noviherbaspirillum galbum]|uniref:Uncharacterized protein n=1 Tax=Noviherbaspirillum galbum TaxID=2709383 RepID=A0A6B3SGR2_9BURK|nr:hypothetical protein [Noviherbaspirillum galbum]NEX60067.1 hypothetical protein [Noviherbaspirillum galbum]
MDKNLISPEKVATLFRCRLFNGVASMGRQNFPEARRAMINALADAQRVWMETMAGEFFSDPSDPVNLEIFLQAQLEAASNFFRAYEARATVMRTFALTLLDEASDS